MASCFGFKAVTVRSTFQAEAIEMLPLLRLPYRGGRGHGSRVDEQWTRVPAMKRDQLPGIRGRKEKGWYGARVGGALPWGFGSSRRGGRNQPSPIWAGVSYGQRFQHPPPRLFIASPELACSASVHSGHLCWFCSCHGGRHIYISKGLSVFWGTVLWQNFAYILDLFCFSDYGVKSSLVMGIWSSIG